MALDHRMRMDQLATVANDPSAFPGPYEYLYLLSMNEKDVLRRTLIEVAKNGTKISYRDAAAAIGRRPNNISRILDEINTSEHKECRPMLPAVVMVSGRRVPGDGFFTQAIKLGKPAPDPRKTTSIRVQRKFWEPELDRVHSYWA